MNRRTLLIIGGIVLLIFLAIIIYFGIRKPAQPAATTTPSSTISTTGQLVPTITASTYVSSDPAEGDSILSTNLYRVNIAFSKIMVPPSDIKVTKDGKSVTTDKTQIIDAGLGLNVPVRSWTTGVYTVNYLACAAGDNGACHEGQYGFTVQ